MEKEVVEDQSLVHEFEEVKPKMKLSKNIIIICVVAIVLGLGSGYLFASSKGGAVVQYKKAGEGTTAESFKKGDIVGVKDDKTFKDQADGIVRLGGIDGEGAYHLERTGGDSQNVYMTSSTVDLAQFIGKKVKVWGETNSAEKAGWLMDVGRLQLL